MTEGPRNKIRGNEALSLSRRGICGDAGSVDRPGVAVEWRVGGEEFLHRDHGGRGRGSGGARSYHVEGWGAQLDLGASGACRGEGSQRAWG